MSDRFFIIEYTFNTDNPHLNANEFEITRYPQGTPQGTRVNFHPMALRTMFLTEMSHCTRIDFNCTVRFIGNMC